MKGYAKGYLSEKTKNELKASIERAYKFVKSAPISNYETQKSKRFLYFFTKEYISFDYARATSDAEANNCTLMLGFGNSWFFYINTCINDYYKILSLAESEEFYLDDELQSVLNDFINKSNN